MKFLSSYYYFATGLFLFASLLTAYSGDGGSSSAPSGVSRMTLESAIIQSLSYDPAIAKIRADSTEARGYAKEVKSDLMPQLFLEGHGGWAQRDRSIDGVATGGEDLFSREIRLVFEQLLWDNKFHWYRWKDSKERLAGKELLNKAQREITALGTTAIYLDLLRDRKQVELAKENLEVHRKIRGLAKERAQAAGNAADVSLSSARYDLALALVRERQLALRQSEVRFTRYVGHRPPATLVKPKPPTVRSSDDIDPMGNFHYQAALRQKAAAKLARKAVKSRYSPRIMFRGGGGLGEDVLGIAGRDNEASALVVVQWDLIDSGRRKGLTTQALADIDRQEAIINETLVLLGQDIGARWEDYSTLVERMGIIRSYSTEISKTVKLYEEQFELGTRPLLSVLDIQQEEIQSTIRLTDQQRDFAMSAYRLLSFGGRLITDTVGEEYLTANDENKGEGRDYYVPATSSAKSVTTESADSSYSPPPLEEKKRFNPFGFLKRNK